MKTFMANPAKIDRKWYLSLIHIQMCIRDRTAYIEFEGEGVVHASDIQADQDIEILNPDLVIAHLSGGKDCKLYMELTITKGRGYVSADKNKSDDLPIGVIAVDSIYTPVERVNMAVQNLSLIHIQMCIRDSVDAAAYLGTVIAKRALEKGITEVVFDRGGYIYQGKVAALAEAAREAGLTFQEGEHIR